LTLFYRTEHPSQREAGLGESIGDLGGAKIAFLAFQKAKAKHPAPTLDGFTSTAHFSLLWVSAWDAIRPETQRKMVQEIHPMRSTGDRAVVEYAGFC